MCHADTLNWRTQLNDTFKPVLRGLGLWCLTPLSIVSQLYRGGSVSLSPLIFPIIRNIKIGPDHF